MLFAEAGGILSAFSAVTDAWRLSLSSVHFLLFLPLAVGVYFLFPARLRRPWLLIASYYFYFWAAPKYLPVLLLGTLFTYLCGRAIGGAKSMGARRGWVVFAVAGAVLGLAFFKYNGFFATFLSAPLHSIGIPYDSGFFTTAGALGISFYTFTAIGYLFDVYREDTPAEKNLLNYALFIGFFPSVTMGPISRAGGLLPQLKDDTRRFDAASAADGLRRMAIGYFKKLAVADTLAVFTGAIYGNLPEYQGLTLTLAAIAYALQLYFDFSGYSDIAIGTAQLLGIKLPENFANPYFATNFSLFWQRWHISLSSWLQDYIFTPLVWSRWTEKLPIIGKHVHKPPVLTALAATFLISGIWHGDTLCFLIWGALQAVYRIGEEVLHRTLGKPKKKLNPWLRAGKTVIVLALWVESLVFFKVGTDGGSVASAASALVRQFLPVSLAQVGQDITAAIANGFFNKPFMVALFLLFSLFALCLALWADWFQNYRLKGAQLSGWLQSLRTAPKFLLYFLIVLCCFVGFLAQSGGFEGNFIYGNI
ncbi:MAG: MBOAT family protein [Ruminococcaceae bacterium]|nr:MBOAT family protein [Oscillospiraceae bacterium]